MNNNLITAKIEKKIIESPTSVSLILKFQNPEQKLNYTAGQFISLYINIDNKEIKRSYSLSSAPHEDKIQISIKKIKDGNLSVHLVDKIKEGSLVKLSLAKGKFFTWPQSTPKQYILLGAGSGTAPLFSILKSILHTNLTDKVLFICSHKNEKEILFYKTLKNLSLKYPDRLQIIYSLSQIDKKNTFTSSSKNNKYLGKINSSLIKNILNQYLVPLWEKEFYICGPTKYMTEHIENLLFLGVAEKNLHIESFVSKIRQADDKDNPFKQLLNASQTNIKNQYKSPDAGFLIGDKQAKREKTEKIIISMDGQTHSINYQDKKSILENILEAGIDAPYSCLSGACLSCLARITRGCVNQKDLGILDDSNIKKKESLLCQAYPLSKTVHLTFD